MIVTLETSKTGDGLIARHPDTRKIGFPAKGTRIPAGATPGARWAVELTSETEKVWFFRLVEPEDAYIDRLLREKEASRVAEERRKIAIFREALPVWESLLDQHPGEEELATTVALIRQAVKVGKVPAGILADHFAAGGPYMKSVTERALASTLAALGAPPPYVPVPARDDLASPVYHPADAMDSKHVVALPDGRYVLRTLRDNSSGRKGVRVYESETEISREEYLRLVEEWNTLRAGLEDKERRRAENASQLEAYCASLPEQLDDETFRKGKNLCDRWGNVLEQIPQKAAREGWSVEQLLDWLADMYSE